MATRKRARKNPVWWREVAENEAKMVARTYVDALGDVSAFITSKSKGISIKEIMPPTEEMFRNLIDHNTLRLTDGSSWLETKAPPLHAVPSTCFRQGDGEL